MRNGENGELIFEGSTEARVASELLSQLGSGSLSGLLDRAGMDPPLEAPRIGRVEFLGRRILEAVSRGEQQNYVVPAEKADIVLEAISIASIPNFLISLVPKVLKRNAFMSDRIYRSRNTYELGGK